MDVKKIARNLAGTAFVVGMMGTGVQGREDICSTYEGWCQYYVEVCATWFPEQCGMLGVFDNEQEVVEGCNALMIDKSCAAYTDSATQVAFDCWICYIQH